MRSRDVKVRSMSLLPHNLLPVDKPGRKPEGKGGLTMNAWRPASGDTGQSREGRTWIRRRKGRIGNTAISATEQAIHSINKYLFLLGLGRHQ